MDEDPDFQRPFTRRERIRYSYPVVFAEAAWMWVYRKFDDLRTPKPPWEIDRPNVPRETKES
jgi:hypothetical protein